MSKSVSRTLAASAVAVLLAAAPSFADEPPAAAPPQEAPKEAPPSEGAPAAEPGHEGHDHGPGEHPAAALKLGDPAPELAVAKWVSGEPMTLAAAKGKVVVVEFWATWCPPCRESIPHLGKLYTELKDKGVEIIGITDEDEATVAPFFKEWADRMTYRVAIDADGTTAKAYMEPFGVGGIPHAFVVDKAGKLAWHGHPMAGLDDVVKGLLDGTFDAGAHASIAALEEKFQSVVQTLEGEQDLPKLLPVVDELLAATPKTLRWYEIKTQILDRVGRGAETTAVWRAYGEKNKTNAAALVDASERLSGGPDLATRDIGAALAFAAEAVSLTKGDHAGALAALARSQYAAGWVAEAVATQAKAVEKSAAADKAAQEAVLKYLQGVAALPKPMPKVEGGPVGK